MKGGCLCGRVRYEIAGDPLAVVTCHCTHCQKQSGAAFSLVVAIPREALQLTGALTTYEDQGYQRPAGIPAVLRHLRLAGADRYAARAR